MDTERDVTRIVRSWLRTDEHESADRVLDTVLGRLDTTRQRRSWWPAWRFADMNTYAKLAIAAAAVVIVAVVGINLLPARGGGSGRRRLAFAFALPLADRDAAAQSVADACGRVSREGQASGLGARHPMTLEGVPFTFTVPTSDWISNGDFGIDKSAGVGSNGAGFIFWVDDTPTGVFADPCAAD